MITRTRGNRWRFTCVEQADPSHEAAADALAARTWLTHADAERVAENHHRRWHTREQP